jgi:hypothetical protein
MRRMGLLAAGLTAALVAGCGGGSNLGPSISAIKKTETAYLTAVAHGDGATACDQLTSAQSAAVLQAGVGAGASSCETAIKAFAHSLGATSKQALLSAKIVNVQVDPPNGSAQLKGNSRTYMFQKVAGRWLISGGVAGTSAPASTAVPKSGVSAATYVHAVCAAIGPFEKKVQASASVLSPSAITNASTGKSALQSFLKSVSAEAGAAVSQLQAAGTPKVAGGAAIETSIVGAFTRLDSSLQVATNSADALPTTSASAFHAAATALGKTIQSSTAGITASLGGLKSPALQAAASKDPACASLTG